MCHTPKNFLGADKKKYALTGNFIEGFYAPNITSTDLANTPTSEIEDVFLKDQLIGGGEVQGPMKEVNHYSLIYLNDVDLHAITTYLQSVKSQIPPKPKASNQVDSKTGETIYNKYCVACHKTGAGGAPILGNASQWDPLLKTGLNEIMKNAINGIKAMPPKGLCSTCSNAEIQATVKYMVSKLGKSSDR